MLGIICSGFFTLSLVSSPLLFSLTLMRHHKKKQNNTFHQILAEQNFSGNGEKAMTVISGRRISVPSVDFVYG